MYIPKKFVPYLVLVSLFILLDICILMGWLTIKSPWEAAIMGLIFASCLFLYGHWLGFTIFSALITSPLYLLYVVILLLKSDNGRLALGLLGLLNSIPPFALFLLICLLASSLLVFGFKYDLIFDKTIDPDYYSQFPLLNKIVSTIKLIVKYLALGWILTLAFMLIWNKIAAQAGWVIFPFPNISEFQWAKIIKWDWFWKINSSAVVLLALIDIWRCLHAPLWDVFISYKSKNVETARIITDRLIASGKKVWFAEYQVLLATRYRFQEAINRGIRKSKYGIALTNDDYANSEFCEIEIRRLLKSCGPKNIFEIMIPNEPATHQKYRQLDTALSHLFTGNVDETLSFISQKTGWKIAPGLEINLKQKEDIFMGDCLGESYSIDVSGWKLVDRSFHGGGPCYVTNVEGKEVYWNLQYGEEYSPEVYEARFSLNQSDERKIYDQLCKYADHYFRDLKSGSKVTGVHLFFLGGASHFAVTYSDENTWKRRYSIILVHPKTARAAEFIFTFQFLGPFSQYCSYVQLMDDLVKTLKWGEYQEGVLKESQQAAYNEPSQKKERLERVIEDQGMANKIFNEGLNFAKRGQLENAVSAWEKALGYTTLIEFRSMVLFNMGRACEKMNDEKKAIQYYEESVETNPTQFNALCNIGSIYMRNCEPEEALKYLLKAAESNSNDELTINNIIFCYEVLGDSDKAELWRNKL